jgi:3-deoxy-D-manno-octulosonic-acid transferase
MRTSSDAERILQLGANPAVVRVAGNTKFDILPGPPTADTLSATRLWLGLGEGQSIITLGSAREGECEILFEALRKINTEPMPTAVVAPRHLGLVGQIEQVCRDFDYTYATIGPGRPERGRGGLGPKVIIVAEMGRLLEVYAVSDVAIVGGTFRPFGGHNPLEPASQGVVTIVGPYIQNIVDDIEYLRSRDCALIAKPAELGKALQAILTNGPWREEAGRRAIQAVNDRKGISQKCVAMIEERGLLP